MKKILSFIVSKKLVLIFLWNECQHRGMGRESWDKNAIHKCFTILNTPRVVFKEINNQFIKLHINSKKLHSCVKPNFLQGISQLQLKELLWNKNKLPKKISWIKRDNLEPVTKYFETLLSFRIVSLYRKWNGAGWWLLDTECTNCLTSRRTTFNLGSSGMRNFRKISKLKISLPEIKVWK